MSSPGSSGRASTNERGRFLRVDPCSLGEFNTDPSSTTFSPDRRDAQMTYVGLACRCDSVRFHLSGWPRVASGRGGFFWRTVTRVWREARLPMLDGEPAESPFWLPVFARCDRCSREAVLLDGAGVVGQMSDARRDEPRESYRCRVCRRGSVELAVGYAAHPEYRSRVDFEVVTRCRGCHRQARVAWSEGGRPSDQEVRLDRLYGRR